MIFSRNIKLVSVFAIMLIVGIIVWQYQNNLKVSSISNFDECAQAGYPIMESYPEQCRTPNGKTFTKQVSPEPQTELQQQTIEEISLSFQYPKDLVYRKEIADNQGSIRTAGFFLTKGSENNPEYQMYGLDVQYKDATEQDLELAKKEMDPKTIKEVMLGGYKGIEGLIVGQKTRYITIILRGKKLFTVSTMPPTPENKAITDQILPTFEFK